MNRNAPSGAAKTGTIFLVYSSLSTSREFCASSAPATAKIVNEAKATGIQLLVLEDLTHIRDRIKANHRVQSRLHRWAFRELQEMIIYKGSMAGMVVIKVDPRYTSQTCSRCHKIGKRHKHRFVCEHCGFQAHSDLNASRNLQGLGCLQISQGLL
ncbi:MAG: transposase [Burkholderiaceae bacterium]|nr:transposase [Burkholderiaceae bacterium]